MLITYVRLFFYSVEIYNSNSVEIVPDKLESMCLTRSVEECTTHTVHEHLLYTYSFVPNKTMNSYPDDFCAVTRLA